MGVLRRLGIYRQELPPVALAAGALFAMDLGEALAANAADALYLSRVGPSGLGAQLAASSVLLVATLAMVGGLADRHERARLLSRLAAAAAGLLLVARGALALWPEAAPQTLLILTKQLAAGLDLAFWVLVADRFDARQGRRVVPFLAAVGGLGLVAGSFATRPLARVLGVEELFACGAAATALAALAAAALARRDRDRAPRVGEVLARAGAAPPAGPGATARAIRDGLRATRASELARRLALVVAAAGALGPLLYYALGAAATAAAPGEAELAAFYGRFRGVVHLATLFAQVALMPLALRHLGVGRALLVAPAVAAAAGAALCARADLAVAAAAQGAARVCDAAVQGPSEKLVMNLLLRDVRGRVGGFLDGVAKRLGAIAGAGLVAMAAAAPALLGPAALAVAAAWLLGAALLCRRYPALAVGELAARRHAPDDLAPALDEATVRLLRRDLLSADDDRREAAIALLARARPELAVVELARAARAAPAARGRLVAALDRLLEEDEALRRTALPVGGDLVAILDDGAPAPPLERANVVQAFGRLADGAAFAAERARLERLAAGDPAPAVRLAARAALARRAGDSAALDAAIDDVLALSPAAREARAVALVAGLRGGALAVERVSTDPALRTNALEELRAEALAAAPPRRDALAGWLATVAAVGEPDERALALDAVARAAARPGGDGAGAWRPAAVEAAEVVVADRLAPTAARAAAARALGAVGGVAQAEALARLLGDADEAVRGEAGAALAGLGARALPVLLVAARFGRRAARDAALEILRGLETPASALDDAIEAELVELHATTLRRAAIAAAAGDAPAALLALRLEDRLAEISRTLLLLVEVRLGDPRVGAAAGRALGAGDRRARARALEALDALLPRALARRVVAALDDAPLEERAARAAAAAGVAGPPAPEEAVRAELAGPDPLARALVVHALGARGRAAHREAIREAARLSAADLDPVRFLRRLSAAGATTREDPEMPSSVEAMALLREVPIFAHLTARQLAELAGAVAWETHAAGAAVTADDALYVVAAGRVRLELAAAPVELGPGAAFGEANLLAAAAAPLRATTLERARLLRLGRAELERVVEDEPRIALAMCRALARKA